MLISKRNLVSDLSSEGSWYGGGLDEAADAHADYPITRLESASALKYRTTDVTSPKPIRRQLSTTKDPRKCGIVSLHGHNLSSRANIRCLVDDRISYGPAVDLPISGTNTIATGSNLDYEADLAVEIWFKVNSRIAGTTTIVAHGTDWSIGVINLGASGLGLKIHADRTIGAAKVANSTIRVDDGIYHRALVYVSDTADEVGISVDGESWVTTSLAGTAFTAGANQVLTVNDGIEIAYLAMWNDDLSQAVLTAMPAYTKMVGSEDQLELLWKFDEKTGTSLADATGNSHTGTITGGSWKSFINPECRYDSGWRAVGGRWKRRPYWRSLTTNTVHAKSGLLSNSRSYTWAGWLRLDRRYPINYSTFNYFGGFGTGSFLTSTSTAHEFIVSTSSADTSSVAFTVSRYGGSSISIDATLDYSWNYYVLVVDGYEDKAYVYKNGTLVSSASCNSYTAKSAERMFIGRSVSSSQPTPGLFELCGDMMLLDIPLTATAVSNLAKYARPYTEEYAYLYYDFQEASGTTIDNRGTAGSNGDITISAGAEGTDFEWRERLTDTTSYILAGDYEDHPRNIWFALPSDVDCRDVTILVDDPDNSDGYFEFAYMGIWPAVRLQYGPPPGSEFQEITPGFSSGLSKFPHKNVGGDARKFRVPIAALTQKEYHDLAHVLDRLKGPVAVVTMSDNEMATEQYQTTAGDTALLCVVKDTQPFTDMEYQDDVDRDFTYSRDLVVDEIPWPGDGVVR